MIYFVPEGVTVAVLFFGIQVIPAFEEAVSGMALGGIRRWVKSAFLPRDRIRYTERDFFFFLLFFLLG